MENIEDNRLPKEKLSEGLETAKPFRNFRFILDQNDEYLQRWYQFKSSKQKELVKNQLSELKISD